MRVAPYIAIPVLGLLALPWACGGDDESTGPQGTGGQAQPCSVEGDCEDNNGCTFDFCIDGLCRHDFNDGPDPEAVQISGDCQTFVCAQGASALEVDVTDEPDDGNEGDCTIPLCEPDGTPSTQNQEDGMFCSLAGNQGVCGNGTCSCEPPGANADVFVDPVEGTDSLTQGGAPGGCAFRTIDYALAHSNGQIRLAFQDYGPTDATYPIVLTGQQSINCPYDDQTMMGVTISGFGTFQTTTSVIVFNGTSNGIDDCDIDATGADHGVVVATPSAGEPHFLAFADIHDATSDGVLFLTGATGFQSYMARSSGNGGAGINFGASAQQGYMGESQFQGNTGADVLCGDMSPGLGGDNNTVGICTGCDNCPFN